MSSEASLPPQPTARVTRRSTRQSGSPNLQASMDLSEQAKVKKETVTPINTRSRSRRGTTQSPVEANPSPEIPANSSTSIIHTSDGRRRSSSSTKKRKVDEAPQDSADLSGRRRAVKIPHSKQIIKIQPMVLDTAGTEQSIHPEESFDDKSKSSKQKATKRQRVKEPGEAADHERTEVHNPARRASSALHLFQLADPDPSTDATEKQTFSRPISPITAPVTVPPLQHNHPSPPDNEDTELKAADTAHMANSQIQTTDSSKIDNTETIITPSKAPAKVPAARSKKVPTVPAHGQGTQGQATDLSKSDNAEITPTPSKPPVKVPTARSKKVPTVPALATHGQEAQGQTTAAQETSRTQAAGASSDEVFPTRRSQTKPAAIKGPSKGAASKANLGKTSNKAPNGKPITTRPVSTRSSSRLSANKMSFANGGSVVNINVVQPEINNEPGEQGSSHCDINNQDARNNQRIRESDSNDAVNKQELVRTAKTEMETIGHEYVELRRRRIQLELDAIELEEEQVRNETHAAFKELEATYEAREHINQNQKRLRIEWADKECEAKIKQANDDFIVRRYEARRKMIQDIQEKEWKLKEERRKAEAGELWANAETSADIYVRCKQREIEQLRRSSSGVPPYVATYPKEIKRLLRENKLQGGRVIVPPRRCEGLLPSEIDLDLEIIRAASAPAEH